MNKLSIITLSALVLCIPAISQAAEYDEFEKTYSNKLVLKNTTCTHVEQDEVDTILDEIRDSVLKTTLQVNNITPQGVIKKSMSRVTNKEINFDPMPILSGRIDTSGMHDRMIVSYGWQNIDADNDNARFIIRMKGRLGETGITKGRWVVTHAHTKNNKCSFSGRIYQQ